MRDAETTEQFLREGLREKALHILRPLYLQADVERYEHCIIIEDDEGGRDDDPGMNTYCADCIEAAMEEYRKENASELEGKTVDYTYYEGCEHEGFVHCDKCGKAINTCLLLDGQELEYWEGETPLDPLSNAERAWELTEILNNQDDEFEDRIDKIARRIIRETGYLPSRKVKTAHVRWIDFLSPDIKRSSYYGSLKYGFERTIYALQWIGKTLAHDASSYWYPAALRGKNWREDLFNHFHTFLVQEYGRSFTDGNCSVFHWDTLAERREQVLTFDRPQKISIPEVHRWPFEVDEYAFDTLMTGYEGKKLTRNPQVDLDGKGYGCRDRGGWHWEFGQASFHVYSTLLSFHIEYHAPEASGSSWDLQIPQKDDEPLFDFLVRIADTLELYVLRDMQSASSLF